jgi:hypothetical protein
VPPMRVTAAYDSDNRPPSAFNSHTSPLMPKNIRSGKPPPTPVPFRRAAVAWSRFSPLGRAVDLIPPWRLP